MEKCETQDRSLEFNVSLLSSTRFGHSRQVDITAGKLPVAIIFSQAPHFSLVQSDVFVDTEVVQPVVITLWVDLERRV